MKNTGDSSGSPLGKNIKRLREARDLNQEDLAQIVGVHANVIGNMERGSSEGRYENRVAIAQALGTTVSALYEPDDFDSRLDRPSISDAVLILSAFERAPRSVRELVLKLLFEVKAGQPFPELTRFLEQAKKARS